MTSPGGRGKRVSPRDVMKILQLYCERDYNGNWMHSFTGISKLAQVDHKTVMNVIRENAVPLINRHLLRRHKR